MEEEEQFHDGGTRFLPGGRIQPDCECGWRGTVTFNVLDAMKERDQHERENLHA